MGWKFVKLIGRHVHPSSLVVGICPTENNKSNSVSVIVSIINMRNMNTTYTFIHTQLIVLAVDPFPSQPQSPHGPGLPPTAPGPVDPPPVHKCPRLQSSASAIILNSSAVSCLLLLSLLRRADRVSASISTIGKLQLVIGQQCVLHKPIHWKKSPKACRLNRISSCR